MSISREVAKELGKQMKRQEPCDNEKESTDTIHKKLTKILQTAKDMECTAMTEHIEATFKMVEAIGGMPFPQDRALMYLLSDMLVFAPQKRALILGLVTGALMGDYQRVGDPENPMTGIVDEDGKRMTVNELMAEVEGVKP